MALQSYWRQMRRWVSLRTEWVERMWVREDRTAGRRGGGEHRWTWVWLGKDATDTDIGELVRQLQEEISRLPTPLGIEDFMVTLSAWGPRRDGVGEEVYLEARRAGDLAAIEKDLAMRGQPKVVAIGEAARGHVIDRRSWHLGGAREQTLQALRFYRPSHQWRIVEVSLFSVGEAYLRLVAEAAN